MKDQITAEHVRTPAEAPSDPLAVRTKGDDVKTPTNPLAVSERNEFPSLGVFVEDFLSDAYARQVTDTGDSSWCPEWWRHPEALRRLQALWDAYEASRMNGPTGLSIWFRDHADHHMPILLSPRGPFKFCGVRHGHRGLLQPLPTTRNGAPAYLFATRAA
jgi:hypothetical protein